MARTEPLHPRHRKQASTIEKQRGQRFQAVATDLPGHHYPRLDAFHRNHAGIEAVIKDGKDLGLRRLPSFHLAVNQAWCTAVASAADLLAWLRHLALDHHRQLRKATPATLRRAVLNVPARLVHRARKRLIRLCDDHPHQADLILAWQKIRALGTPPCAHLTRPDQMEGPTPGPPRGNQGHTRPPAGLSPHPKPETPTNTKINNGLNRPPS